MAHIRLSDVGVEFPIHNAHSRSLQLQVFGKLGGKLAQHRQAVFVQALQSVTLAFEDGEELVGRLRRIAEAFTLPLDCSTNSLRREVQ